MSRDKLAIALVILAPIWWVGWNIYFGWNAQAQSPLESFTDMMFYVILFGAFIIKPVNSETNYIFNGNPKVNIQRKDSNV